MCFAVKILKIGKYFYLNMTMEEFWASYRQKLKKDNIKN